MMSDGMLSQDEIDALLKNTDEGTGEAELTGGEKQTESVVTADYLSPMEQDTLGEVGNISFGSSATTLSALVNQKVEITTPAVSVVKRHTLAREFSVPYIQVKVEYTAGFSGVNLFMIETRDAAVIANLMLGGDGTEEVKELTDIHLSAVQEAMNQMMGTSATSMSTLFHKKVDISPPELATVQTEDEEPAFDGEDIFVKIAFQLKIGDLIDSTIMQLLPVQFAVELIGPLLNPPEAEKAQESTKQESMPKQAGKSSSGYQSEQQAAASLEASMPLPEPEAEPKQLGRNQTGTVNPAVQKAAFSSFEPVSLPAKEQRNLDMLLDIPLKVTVELGRTRRSVKEILELSSGSIIELDKLAGEPVDILVNDKLVAKGEVVVIEENFGVRVTDILSQSERLKRLN